MRDRGVIRNFHQRRAVAPNNAQRMSTYGRRSIRMAIASTTLLERALSVQLSSRRQSGARHAAPRPELVMLNLPNRLGLAASHDPG